MTKPSTLTGTFQALADRSRRSMVERLTSGPASVSELARPLAMSVEFRASGGGTRLVLTEQGVFLDGHETAAQREEGTRALLDSLAAWLAETSSEESMQ